MAPVLAGMQKSSRKEMFRHRRGDKAARFGTSNLLKTLI
jgi:hypothetical protein